MDYMKVYEDWLKNEYFDEEVRKDLMQIADDEKEIEDRFYKDLEFGTGGLRGVIGIGTNRINKYTVRRATYGLAQHIIEKGDEEKGLVIAHDNRFKSRDFTLEAARTLAACGIKTYIFDGLRPTPQLSFAVRSMGAAGGIVITASHNPPEYNGYKAYGDDGAQLNDKESKKVIEKVNAITDYSKIPVMSEKEAFEKGLIEVLSADLDDDFIEAVKKQSLCKEIVCEVSDELKIVYTPLHGTGNVPVRRVLNEAGFKNVFVVAGQEAPDPNFSTVDYPNPEDPAAFELAINLANEKDADIIIGTDPDCDRVGVVVKEKLGEYRLLTGNQTGALLLHFILKGLKDAGELPENAVVVKTIVTSRMGDVIADSFGVETLDTLTGFRFIAEKIKEFEENGGKNFIYGYEESYGYLAGNHARDKDAVVASMLVAQMAAYYYSKGMNLVDAMHELYKEYGFFSDSLENVVLKGREGAEKIQGIMKMLRENPPTQVGGLEVAGIKDYSKGVEGFPKSNVLVFDLEKDAWFAVRPSGTEPKIKFYFGVKGSSDEESKKVMEALKKGVMDSIK
ncbi:phosphoglucomutase [Peptoclostridium litorale DSM 5388]|uniref:Phosphoglucomutase n=1 Tax=Peptoclostridium litorale DSM 5388 TaxID=1121324 RepID=A0A069RCG9_PEPLI|nr:phospho-sugar mutase [Peptoclostridium litorale]KDR94749.1 phosphoglucomutase PgcA [Peptoclostridium litorale DSM 5388]SIN91831.1 phosphoglucomutase [Peptoclostridium litorale DSM 5388]